MFDVQRRKREQMRPGPGVARRRSMIGAFVAVLVIVGSMTLSGCGNSQHLVGDRLWGEFILATKDTGDTKGPQVSIPESMSSNMVDQQYRADGRIGTRVTFDQLTLGQFDQIGDIIGEAYPNSSVDMNIRATRNGSVVRMRGVADFTPLTPDDYVEMTVRFAGPVSATNGVQTSNEGVTWKPTPGQPAVMTAEADYPDPSTADFGKWTLVITGISLIVVALVIFMAWWFRDRSPRVGKPLDDPDGDSTASEAGDGQAGPTDDRRVHH